MNPEPAPLSSPRTRAMLVGAAALVLAAGYLVRPAAPAVPAPLDERPAPILQEVVSSRDPETMVRRLQEVASETRRFTARLVPAPRALERWSDWNEPPAPDRDRYGVVVDERRLVGRVGDLPDGTAVAVVLGDGRHLTGRVIARVEAEQLGLVEVDASAPLDAPPRSGTVSPGDAAVATAPGTSGPLVAPVFVAGVRGEAILLTTPVDHFDGMAVFAADGAFVGVIATGSPGPRVLPLEAALRPRPAAAPRPAPLGVTLAVRKTADDAASSVVVSELGPDGAAARAGLRAGDVLLEIDGEPVETLDAAVARLRGPDQDATRVRVRRGRRTLERRIDRTAPALQP